MVSAARPPGTASDSRTSSAAPGLLRPGHRAAQPGALPRSGDPRTRLGSARQRRADRRDPPRPRPVQGRERHPWAMWSGDQLLVEVGRRLVGSVGPASVARLGGDEFAALLVDPIDGPRRQRHGSPSRMGKTVFSTPIDLEGRPGRVSSSASMGIVVGRGPDSTRASRAISCATPRSRSTGPSRWRATVGTPSSSPGHERRDDRAARLREQGLRQRRRARPTPASTTSRSSTCPAAGSSASRPWPAGSTPRAAWSRPSRVRPPLAEETGLIVPIGDVGPPRDGLPSGSRLAVRRPAPGGPDRQRERVGPPVPDPRASPSGSTPGAHRGRAAALHCLMLEITESVADARRGGDPDHV